MADNHAATILIVDDEPLARDRLLRLCTNLELDFTLQSCETGVECLAVCEQKPIDLVLLDIEMPGLNGLEVAYQLQALTHTPAIIFCTAYDEFALQAFDAAAVDYLLKPIATERLRAAIGKAKLIQDDKLQQLQQLMPKQSDFLWTTSTKLKQRIAIADIRVLHADSKYVVAMTESGDFLLNQSLKQLETQLGAGFIRVHRGTLINSHYLEGCERSALGDYRACLQGITFKPKISRRLLPRVQAWIKQQSG